MKVSVSTARVPARRGEARNMQWMLEMVGWTSGEERFVN